METKLLDCFLKRRINLSGLLALSQDLIVVFWYRLYDSEVLGCVVRLKYYQVCDSNLKHRLELEKTRKHELF